MLVKSSYITVEGLIKKTSLPDDAFGKILLEFPIQRPAGQWNNEKKGRLIHSILSNDPIPALYITNDGSELFPQMLLDGVQRVSTVINFVCSSEGKRPMKLWNKTPSVEIRKLITNPDGTKSRGTQVVELAGKTFKELPKEAQDLIMDFRFDTKILEEFDHEDLARIMYNLNNGQAATATQKAVMKLGMKTGEKIKELTQTELFVDKFLFTNKEERGSEAHKCVLFSLLHWSGQEYEDFSYSKLTGATLNSLIDKYSDTWTETHISGIRNIFDTLSEMLPDNAELYRPYLKSTHLPVWVMNTDKFLGLLEDGEISESQYKEFLEFWFEEGVNSKEFQALAVEDGKNISAKSNIEARTELMDKALDNFLQTGELGLTCPKKENATPQTIEECEEEIKTTFQVDGLTAMRSILNTTQNGFFYSYDDSVEYGLLLPEEEINESVFRTNDVTEMLSGNNIGKIELPSYYEAYKLAIEDGVSKEQFKEWVDHWLNNITGEYLGLLSSYKETSAAQTALTNCLHNDLLNYVLSREPQNKTA